MKLLGAILILTSGYLISRQMMKPSLHHFLLLKEGDNLFRILESEIRNQKTPLPELFQNISERAQTEWKAFFADFYKSMNGQEDFLFSAEFERLFTVHLSEYFSEEEESLFLQAGQNLFSPDLLFQKNNIARLSEHLNRMLIQQREDAEKQNRAYLALCLSASALIIIILIETNGEESENTMTIELIFKIAAVGVLVTILAQVLKHAGRDEQAFLVSLVGLFLVLSWIIPCIEELFQQVYDLFTF